MVDAEEGLGTRSECGIRYGLPQDNCSHVKYLLSDFKLKLLDLIWIPDGANWDVTDT